jgi:aspartate/methionine/tyrosine aminotransferase
MQLKPFEMERYQSLWENVVEYNLSESGVHPLKLNELCPGEQLEEILNTPLGYNQTNGSEALRSSIAAIYPEAQIENVLVTAGSAEANFLSIWNLVEQGDEIALMLPNYMQIWGLAQAFGANVKPFHLVPDNNRWQIDWEKFEKAISPQTKLIAICNPNNPTGAVLTENEMGRICETAKKVDAWILSDEVYRGAERTGETVPSFWGMYDKVIVNSGLSKAYGLPGLRIGWNLAPAKLIEELWGYHDYTTICPSPISDRLARIALQPDIRKKILERTRNAVKNNFDILWNWITTHEGVFECIPPIAGAITLLKHNLTIKSDDLVLKIRNEKSVLIVPGEQFLMDGYLRIGFGCPANQLTEALNRVSEVIKTIRFK